MSKGFKKKAGDFLKSEPETPTPSRRYYQASGADFEHILKHNADRDLVPVVRQANGHTVFSFCPRSSCFNGRVVKLRGVTVEVFEV